MSEPPVFKPTIDVLPPDISPYREGNTGIEYVTTFDSGKPGPHVMINALTHGNELCGAHALCFLFEQAVRPIRGKLTLSFANHRAFAAFDPDAPFASRFVNEDFNRLWTDEVLDGERDSWELQRARVLRPLVSQVDHLLDLHSMHFPAQALLITGLRDKSVQLARELGFPAHVVIDEGHKAGKRMRDYNAFDDPDSPKTAMLVECGQHWARSSVEVARLTTLHFLRRHGMVEPALLEAHLPGREPEPQTFIEVSRPVTVESGKFRFVEDYRGFEVIERAGTLIAYDGEAEVRTPYDNCVLVMPSPGNGRKPGLTAVRLGRIVG
jgi:predicted deacylase